MDLRVQGLEEREAGWKAEWKTANDRLTAAITAMAYNIQVIGAKLVPLDDLHQWKPQVDAAMEEIRGDVGDLRKQVERVIQPTVDDHTPQKPAPPTRLPEDDALGPDGHREERHHRVSTMHFSGAAARWLQSVAPRLSRLSSVRC